MHDKRSSQELVNKIQDLIDSYLDLLDKVDELEEENERLQSECDHKHNLIQDLAYKYNHSFI